VSARTLPDQAAGLPDPRASIIIVGFNSLAYLDRCLVSVLRDAGPDTEVLLLDNGSTDRTTERLADRFPRVRRLRSEQNLGFAGGCNLAAGWARGRYLVFLNPDTEVADGWSEALISALEADPALGLATSRITLRDHPARLNAAGNDVHLTGLTLCRGAGRPAADYDRPADVAAVSGAAFAIRRDLFELLEGFDPSFFTYLEDTDLSLRARLAGYRSVYVPESLVLHDYRLRFGPLKSYYQERNRYLMLLKLYRWPTLLLLLPPLILAELVAWGCVLLADRGHWPNKLRAYRYMLSRWRPIWRSRARVQALRAVPDRQLLAATTSALDYGQSGLARSSRAARRLFDPFFAPYRRFLLRVVRW
jgi:GT2 family glycosyltransferase